jgi:uncharacterized protein (TIGR02118 family)
MKLLLTVGFDGDRDTLEGALLDWASRFVEGGGAARAAVDVRAGGAEGDQMAAMNTEQEAQAMVSLWDVDSPDAALSFPWPDGVRLVGAYEVKEIVQKDWDRTWPAGASSPGVKLVCLVRRKVGMPHDDYLQHWRDNHGPLAVARQPGFWHYVQNHVVGWLTDGTPDFDGVGELHFRSPAEVETGMFDSEEGQRLIWEDTLRFMDHDTSTVLVTTETLIDADQFQGHVPTP